MNDYKEINKELHFRPGIVIDRSGLPLWNAILNTQEQAIITCLCPGIQRVWGLEAQVLRGFSFWVHI